MPTIGLGDMAQSFAMRHHVDQTKTAITRLSQELSTGRVADTAHHLSGNLRMLNSIDSSLARLTSYETVTRELGMFSDAMQIGLASISSQSLDVAQGLITASILGTIDQVKANATAAHATLASTISVLNTRSADRTLFAGTESGSVALASPHQFMTAIETAVTASGAQDVATVEAAIDAWFSAPGGYVGTGYLGGPPLSPVPVAPDELANPLPTANDPALRSTLKGLAMAALLDRGLFANQDTLQKGLAQRAGEVLLAGEKDRVELAAGLGRLQAQLDQTRTRNQSESAALTLAREGMLQVDPYETATRLQAAEGQLQLLYTLTVRLSRLNLADYL